MNRETVHVKIGVATLDGQRLQLHCLIDPGDTVAAAGRRGLLPADQDGRDECVQFVDRLQVQQCAKHPGSALDQYPGHLASSQFMQQRAQSLTRIRSGRAEQFAAGLFQETAVGRIRLRADRDQQGRLFEGLDELTIE